MTLQFADLTLRTAITDIWRFVQFCAFRLLKVRAFFEAFGLVAGIAVLPIGKLAGAA